MARGTEKPGRPRGRPRRYAPGRRPVLTFRIQEAMHNELMKAAAENQRSISEEIESRLASWAAWLKTKADIDEMRAKAAAWVDAARVQAIRAAGLTILREIEGRPTRVVVDLETLLAEADGIARGLRSGFSEGPPPVIEPPQPMTAEEVQRLMEEIEAIKRRLEEAMERTRAADAAATSDKSGNEAA